MRFRSADGLVLAYLAAHEGALAPKTPSMGQRGREYGPRCSNRKCRRTVRRTQIARKGVLIERCAYCGTVWPFSDAYVLAGQNHSGRGGRAPARLRRAGDLAALIHALESTPDLRAGYADLYIAWLGVGSKTVEAVAADADAIRLEGERWTKSRVWTAICRSRGWLEDQLDRRGLRATEGIWSGQNA